MYNFNSEKHIHTIDEKPLMGTSTVMGIVAKPLTWWASGLACEKLGWTNSKKKIGGKYTTIPLESRITVAEPVLIQIKAMDTKEYLGLLDEAYKAHSVKLDTSATAGTDLHAELEGFVKWHMADKPLDIAYSPKIQPFIDWTQKNVKRFLWSEMHCYSEYLWVGGITDCGFEDNDGKYGIMDFKSSKEAYVSQFMQIAGYDLQIQENGGFDSKGNKIFTLDKPISYYCVLPFGADNPEPTYSHDVEELKNGFKSAVTLYKIVNGAEKE